MVNAGQIGAVVANQSLGVRNMTYEQLKLKYGDGSSAASAGESALAIKTLTGTNTDGVYWINLPTAGPTQVYCVMDSTYDGGGWMLVMKGDKALQNNTFSYSSPHWTTATTLNPTSLNRNAGDAKYQPFNYYAAKDIMALWPDMTQANVMAERLYAFRLTKNDYDIREENITDISGATAAAYTGGTSIALAPLEISGRVAPTPYMFGTQFTRTTPNPYNASYIHNSPTYAAYYGTINGTLKPYTAVVGDPYSYTSMFNVPANTVICVGVNKGSTTRSAGPNVMYFQELTYGIVGGYPTDTVVATTTLVDGVANTITLTTTSTTVSGRFVVADAAALNYYLGASYSNDFIADFYCYKPTTSQITWTGGSITNNTQWSWLENNFNNGKRVTLKNFFNQSFLPGYAGSGLFKRDAKTFTGWANGVFSSQTDIRFYGFNYNSYYNATYPSVNGAVRWGFGWNENGEGLWPSAGAGANTYIGSNDVFGGIGLGSSASRSAGDFVVSSQDTTGMNRSARFEVYVR